MLLIFELVLYYILHLTEFTHVNTRLLLEI